MDSYLTAAAARTLAAGVMAVPGMAQLLALSDSALAMALATASSDIDVAMNYQGRKYDRNQTREFPRIAYGSSTGGVNQFGIPVVDVSGAHQYPFTPDTVVWDWDQAALAPVVPANVQLACLFQAASLQLRSNAKRIEQAHGGVTDQKIGTAGETLDAGADGVQTNLCKRAFQIMDKYRLRSGQML